MAFRVCRGGYRVRLSGNVGLMVPIRNLPLSAKLAGRSPTGGKLGLMVPMRTLPSSSIAGLRVLTTFCALISLTATSKHDYERAVVVGRRVVKANPAFINGYKPLIASLGHLGRREEAAPYVERLLSLEPDFTIEKFRKAYPFKRQQDRDDYCKGLRLAGIPKR